MALVKRSVRLAGHATSVSLEPAFWEALAAIATQRGLRLEALIEEIDRDRVSTSDSLASTLRVHVLKVALAGYSPGTSSAPLPGGSGGSAEPSGAAAGGSGGSSAGGA